ncbi:IgGFc-binding protein-like [Saccoglossus kowalevskii]
MLSRLQCMLVAIALVHTSKLCFAEDGGTWSDWDASWSDCSVTCGGGTQTRKRVCLVEPCVGSDTEEQTCMDVDCPLEIDYGHKGCWACTEKMVKLENTRNGYIDANDPARGCARAAYSGGYDYFVLKDNGDCYAVSTSADYEEGGADESCRFGEGTSTGCDVYEITPWMCPDGTESAGLCMGPPFRTPLPPTVCRATEYCHKVGGTTTTPVAICCEKKFCKDNCGKKIIERDCWCDDDCVKYGDCCDDHMVDCSGYGSCSGCGDPHYTNFDNRRFDYQGKCEYVMMSSRCPQPYMQLEIIVKNRDWPYPGSPVTTTKEVHVIVEGIDILLMQGNKLMIDGTLTAVPVDVTPRTRVTLAGIYLVVTTGYGIVVYFDGIYNLRIEASNLHRGRLCGLCGNFDGNWGNDFTRPDGTLTNNAATFGDSWIIANADCNPARRSVERLVTRSSAKTICNDLFNAGNIRDCAGTVDPGFYQDSCIMDVQYSLPSTTEGCSVVADYVNQCNVAGVEIGDWRSGTQCEIDCPVAGTAYNHCGPLCPPTCLEPHPLQSCVEKCTEGCFCADGLVLDEGGVCVEESKCGCYYLETLYRFHEELPNEKYCCCNVTDKICVGERYFEVITQKRNWTTAKNTCEVRGGMLAKIDTHSVDKAIRRYISEYGIDNNNFWFGLNDIDTEGTFYWTDGTALGDFTRWAENEPNNNVNKNPLGQDCVQLWKKNAFKWDDSYCDRRAGFVCEYSFETACP